MLVCPVPLPVPPTLLLHRAEELETARQLLLSDEARLITVMGPAGVGKTHLALEVARELQTAFAQGVRFVDLSRLRDPGLVLPTIAQTLGVREGRGLPLLPALQVHLREQQLLLVLDNFEQVAAAAAAVADLLTASLSLKLLVTSRVRLHLRGEHTLLVRPLAVPDRRIPLTVDSLAAVPAVALFVERARAANPRFALTPDNSAAVADLCVHLDGLPLAIELAAARANVLVPAEMLSWVERRLPVLSSDALDLPQRQRSLQAALAWSYDLLLPSEQALFRRLAVFVGGWTIEAAEAVAEARTLGLDPVQAVSTLVDASLVQMSQAEDGSGWFSFLQSVWEFALQELEASGEYETIRRQHTAHYVALVERAAPALEGPEQSMWFSRLQREHDNLRAALRWVARRGEAETELRLAGNLAFFWSAYGYQREGLRWLEDALARCPDRRDELRLTALEGVGILASYLGESALAELRLEEGIDLARSLGAERAIPRLMRWLFREHLHRGDGQNWRTFAMDLEALRASADPGNLVMALHIVGFMAYEAGNEEAAVVYLGEAVALSKQVGDHAGTAQALASLAVVADAQGDRGRAIDLATEALRLAQDLNYPVATAWCAQAAVRVSAEAVNPGVLARLLGAAHALRATAGMRLTSGEQEQADRLTSTARVALGEDAFGNLWAAGQRLSSQELVSELLALLESEIDRPAPPPQSRSRGLLSPREQEVLALVAQGLTDKEIAERLVLSLSTIMFHLKSIRRKLGARSRTEAVARAAKGGLL